MAHHFYVSTAQKPTAVTHAIACSLAGSVSSSSRSVPLHLVVVKGTWLEVHLVNQVKSAESIGGDGDDDASAGLSLLCEAPLYGTVAALQKFRPEGEQQDRLLIVTERHHYCMLGLELSSGAWQMSTLGHGDLRDRVGQPVDSGPLAVVDPAGKLAALHLYDGLLKVMPLPNAAAAAEALLSGASSSSALGATTAAPYTARLDEPSVADMCFLHTPAATSSTSAGVASAVPPPPLPAIAVLYDSGSTNSSSGARVRKLKTYSVGTRDQELMAGPWPVTDVDAGAALLVPVPQPLGGVLVLGAGLVAYQPPPSATAASSSSSSAGSSGPSSSDRARSSSSSSSAPAMVTAALDFETEITACCAIDEDEEGSSSVAGSRWLLGDSLGRLLVLTLHTAATPDSNAAGASDSDGDEELPPSSSSWSSSSLRVTRLGVSAVGGETSVAEALCFLKHTKGTCFVGSLFGDSQLVQLPSSPSMSLDTSSSSSPSLSSSNNSNTTLPSLEIVEEFTNLGPIVDFVATDVDGTSLNNSTSTSGTSSGSGGSGGQAQVVTCSGAGKDGSLRVVRSGVGFDERAAVGMAGVKGLWALRDRTPVAPGSGSGRGDGGGRGRGDGNDSMFDRYLVTSFIGDTRVLGLSDEDELEEVDVSSSFLPGQTLYTANVTAAAAADSSSSPSLVLQVTSDGAQLLNSEQLTKLRDTRAHWSPSSDSKHDAHDDGGAAAITSACSAGSSVVVALRGGSLVSLSVAPAASGDSSVLSKRATITLENDISCLDLAAGEDLGSRMPPLLAVGTWTDLKVHLLDPATLQALAFVQLGGDNQARSVCLAAVAGIPSLFVGLGDGRLLSYALETPPDADAALAMEEDGLSTTTNADISSLPAPPVTAASALLPPLPPGGASANTRSFVVGVRKELSVGATPVLLTRFRQAPPAKLHHPSSSPSTSGEGSNFDESPNNNSSSRSETGAVAVFAACDRPAMVYGEGGNYTNTPADSSDFLPGRVRLSSVACGGSVAHVSPFHAKAFPHTLAFAVERTKITSKNSKNSSSGGGSGSGGDMMSTNDDDDEDDDDDREALVIGSLEATQRLHVRRVGLNGWQPRRICHLPEAKCVAVACCFAPPGGAMEQHAIRVFDLQSFDEVAHWPLLDGEECLCLTAATHPAWSADSLQDSSGGGGSSMGDNSSSCGVMGAPEGKCIVVGTAFSADDQEYEPSAGRVLVLSLTLHKSGAGGFGGLSSTGGGASSPARTSPSSRGGSFSPSGAAGTSGSSSGGGLAGGASLDVLCERAIKGAVYDVSPLGHSMLACGVGPKVQLFKWAQRAILPPGSSSGGEGSSSSSSPLSWGLEPECAHQGHILALHVKGQRIPTSQLVSKSTAPSSSSSSSSSAGGDTASSAAAATASGDSATEPSSEAATAPAAPAESFIVVVGDLMKSVSVLEYDPIAHTLTESLQDFNNNWITALEPASDSVWVCGEHMSNLLTFKRSSSSKAGGDPSRLGVSGSSGGNKGKLEVCGEFHLGDFVNRLREGSLAMLPPTAPTSATTAAETNAKTGSAEAGTAANSSSGSGAALLGSSLLFGTVGGRVGTLSPLSEVEYHLFVGVQRAITKVVLRDPTSYGSRAAVGSLNHNAFRCFENETKSSEWRGYIDGDLVESFLSLPPKASTAVVKLLLDDGFIGPNFLPAGAGGGSGGSTSGSGRLPANEVQAELVKRIEEMARRH